MFSQACVKNRVHRGGGGRGHTPLGRHLLGRHPPKAETKIKGYLRFYYLQIERLHRHISYPKILPFNFLEIVVFQAKTCKHTKEKE